MKKMIHRDPTKRESRRFHLASIKQRTPAAEDVVEMAGGMAMAMEATMEALLLLSYATHWS